MFNSRKSYSSLSVNVGNSTDTHGEKNKRQIRFVIVSIFVATALLCGLAFLLHFAYRKLYVQNDRLLFKHLDFVSTRHYSALQENGKADFMTIFAMNGIVLNKTNLLQIDLGEIQAILQKHPLLTKIKVSKVLPDTLKIEGTEHLPSAFLILTTPQGARLRLPVAICETPQDASTQPAAIILPPKLNLFCERENAYKAWNYALYPFPFNTQNTGASLPLLFDFNFLNIQTAPGTLITDKNLSAALKLLKYAGATSDNQYFVIAQINFIPPSTLRLLVKPMTDHSKIQPFANFDFDCNHLTPELFTRLTQYLKLVNASPDSTEIRYLNATGESIYSSPKPIK